MQLELTPRAVATLKAPADGQVDYWDTVLPGFGLRISYGGRRTWVVRSRVDGLLRRVTVGLCPEMPLADARARARQVLRQAARGADLRAGTRAREAVRMFGDLAVEYLERHAKPHKRSWRHDERTINVELLSRWRRSRVAAIGRDEVRTLVQGIADRGAPIMANRTLALVRKMLNFALDQAWIEANPAARLPPPGAEQPRHRVLTDAELRKLWHALRLPDGRDDGPSRGSRARSCAALKLRLLTAQRGNQVLRMRWEDVDLQSGWWTIPASLTRRGEPHRVPLSGPALAILQALREGGPPAGAWVFPSRRGTPLVQSGTKLPADVARRLAFRFRGHDLRRTAARGMAAAGVSHEAIARALDLAHRRSPEPSSAPALDEQAARHALDTWARRLSLLVGEEFGAR